jgi:hypothetical protein
VPAEKFNTMVTFSSLFSENMQLTPKTDIREINICSYDIDNYKEMKT